MRIAVTGGRGRVGRAVVDMALAQGHTVVVIDRADARPWPEAASGEGAYRNVTCIDADVTSYADFESALDGCDALIHLAAYAGPRGRPLHEVHNNNVVGSYNAMAIAIRRGISRICQASSINAIGGVYSRKPRYDYFPLDERHPTYNEDPYSLSKWICEAQGDSMARRYEGLTIASLRFHAVVPGPDARMVSSIEEASNGKLDLWGYTSFEAAARACLLALAAEFDGHEAFYVVGPRTTCRVPSLELAQRFYPDVPITGDLSGTRAFFDCTKAERLLGWRHDQDAGEDREGGAGRPGVRPR